MLDKLHSLKNIDLRIFQTGDSVEGFHTKGYVFKKDGMYRIILGSSNLTARALKTNKEWNTRLVGTEDGEVIGEILKEFECLWEDDRTLSYEDFIDDYRIKYKIVEDQRRIAKAAVPVSLPQYRLKPNAMQTAFVKNLLALKEEGQNKALLISATGTGKTYASAFGARELKPGRVLFVVHREQIARQALASFHDVFGDKKEDGSPWTYELLSGNTTDRLKEIVRADLIFGTMQTVSRDDILNRFAPDAFQMIIIDESHHAGAPSYQKIMDYFTPGLWLGMTASPETNRFDVYSIFDHNIAYEIRLQQALEENLLCPFHYFGITDINIDGKVIGDEDSAGRPKNFNRLVRDERVNYILEQAAYYGHSGDRVKGLIFCSRKEEAHILSEKFNERGLRTEARTGEDSAESREAVIERLVRDVPEEEQEKSNCLDYIFTVDIFSEGVDIPEINQVILLRPTASPVVFVQQLGRGLRKAENKDFVVILDFIGNYRNNFLIPIALSGDRSYNKENIRRYAAEGDRMIPGISTIHFDEISRQRIFASIDRANFSDVKLIRENYQNLKYKLGRIPSLQDFDDYGEMDVCRIFDNQRLGSYHAFLVKYEKEYLVQLSEEEEQVIQFISQKLAPGKRVQELAMLKRLFTFRTNVMKHLAEDLKEEYGITLDRQAEKNVVNMMTNRFPSGTGRNTFRECVFIEEDGEDYRISEHYEKMLDNPDFLKIAQELVDFGIARYNRDYRGHYKDTDLVLFQKYTYEDACRLLHWSKNVVPFNIGGYMYDRETKTFPVFINYKKEENISATTRYEDHFLAPDRLIAISKSKRHMESEDVQNFLHAGERGISVHLFVRKDRLDRHNMPNEFYYLGEMSASGHAKEFEMPGTSEKAVEIEWNLDTPVREDLYQYITEP